MVQTAVKNVDIVLTIQGAILKLEYVPTVARQAGKVYFVHKVRTIFFLKNNNKHKNFIFHVSIKVTIKYIYYILSWAMNIYYKYFYVKVK
jgi:hypothetical protein